MEVVRIPKERVGALMGRDGRVKKRIEKQYKVELEVSEDGEVGIGGDNVGCWFAKDIVKAIGRGFEPKDAMMLFKDNYSFFLIDLREWCNSDNAIRRVKGRVIGEEGKIKGEIEEATDSRLSVYGHTIGIIAPAETMELAKDAIEIILRGAKHSALVHFLGKARDRIMLERLRGK